MSSQNGIPGAHTKLRKQHSWRLIEFLCGLVALFGLVTLPQWIQGAASTLQQLYIEECRNLVALPEWLQNLTSLQKLDIRDCPKLCALPEGMHRLTALRELKIEDCPDLSIRCLRESGEDWPKIAHVPNITLDEER